MILREILQVSRENLGRRKNHNKVNETRDMTLSCGSVKRNMLAYSTFVIPKFVNLVK
jgi:hypothetical protein